MYFLEPHVEWFNVFVSTFCADFFNNARLRVPDGLLYKKVILSVDLAMSGNNIVITKFDRF